MPFLPYVGRRAHAKENPAIALRGRTSIRRESATPCEQIAWPARLPSMMADSSLPSAPSYAAHSPGMLAECIALKSSIEEGWAKSENFAANILYTEPDFARFPRRVYIAMEVSM